MVKAILVETEGSINLGFILRLAMNFDIEDIVLVSPRDMDWEEVRRFSAKAHSLIDKLVVKEKLEEAFDEGELRVCTSAIISEGDFLRQPITVEEYRRLLLERGGRVALVFGRESTGLTRDELRQCDVTVTIPTSERYPSLNLSHAVAIMFYETYVTLGKAYREPGRRIPLAPREELVKLEEDMRKLVSCVTRDEKKRERLLGCILNVIRRGSPRRIEARALEFVVKRAMRRMSCA